MTKRTRRNHSPVFKVKVALAAVKGGAGCISQMKHRVSSASAPANACMASPTDCRIGASEGGSGIFPVKGVKGFLVMADTDLEVSGTYSDAETVARAEATLKRMLATPHKPHEPIGKKRRESLPK